MAANRVTVSPFVGDAGGEVEVSVGLDNDAAAYALQVLVDLPGGGGCEVVGASAAATGRAVGFDVSAGIRDGRISLMLYSLDRRTIAAGSGEVARFKVLLDNKPLEATLTAKATITDAGGQGTECTVEPMAFHSLRPQLEIATKAVDFGRVALTDRARREISIRNTGTAELTVSEVTFDRTEFAVTSTLPVNVAPGGAASLTVEFTPAERGNLTAMARIASNSADTYNGVDLSAVPYAVNELTIGSASGVSDSEVTIPLTLSNMDAINGMTLEITLPKQLEYVDGSFALNAERADGHAFTATCNDEGLLKIMVYSLSNTPFKGNKGEIASLRLKLNGKYSCVVKASRAVLPTFYRGEIIDALSDCYSGNVSIMYPTLSVNRELSLGRTAIPKAAVGQLTIHNYGNAPLTVSRLEMDNELLAVGAQLPLTIEPYGSANVEISCEGEATGNIDGTLSVYSNDPDLRLTTVKVAAVRYAENRLTFTGKETSLASAQALVNVSLDNYTPIKGLQFDIAYPAGKLSPSDNAVMTGRADGFQVTRRDIEPGVTRYFVYSLSGQTIEPGCGEVMQIPFDIFDGNVPGELGLTASEFVLSSPELTNMNSELTSAPFSINLTNWLKGDIDRNGEITVIDVTQTISLLIGNEPVEEHLPIIDMNEDGELSIIDITAIISLIINN